MNRTILNVAKRMNQSLVVGRVHTSDVFYRSSSIDECSVMGTFLGKLAFLTLKVRILMKIVLRIHIWVEVMK